MNKYFLILISLLAFSCKKQEIKPTSRVCQTSLEGFNKDNPNVKNDVHNKLRSMYVDSINITYTNVGVFIDSLHYDYFVYVVYTADSFNHVCIAHYDCMGKETSFMKKQ